MLSQDTIHILVGILACGWLLLLRLIVASEGSPARRRLVTAVLTLVSLLAIVFIGRQAHRRMLGHYEPADDDKENAAPAPYHVRINDWEQV